MKYSLFNKPITLITVLLFSYFLFGQQEQVLKEGSNYPADTTKRKAYLKTILELLPEESQSNGQISHLDKTFQDWLDRTGELPPNFDKMPSIPYLPDPLTIDEGGKNIQVTDIKQWNKKRKQLEKELQHYITGTFPPPPDNLNFKVLSEKKDGDITKKTVELTFGPNRKAKMTLKLMIPPGKGPFPVFLTQWNHKDWASIAVRRGYISAIYAGADIKDDTKNYSKIWKGKYDFSLLMARAYGASRVIDYLHKLPFVNKDQIGITGHSRNGKQSLWAAAFDDRIGAVITSSGGSGGELPWRYSRHKYGDEDIGLLTSAQPSWFHPRLKFFIGRENKLPVDQNSFMALIAPRGLMLSSSRRESDGNPWGIEQAHDSTLNVYNFLNAPNNLAVRLRDGNHGTSAKDIEDYIDFFDYIFDRTEHKPKNELFYNYSFKQWREISKENIEPLDYPVKDSMGLLIDSDGKKINTEADWENKKKDVIDNVQWILGKQPAGITNKGPLDFKHSDNRGEAYFGSFITRPKETAEMGRISVSPGLSKPGFGDYLYGELYYPKDQEQRMKEGTTKIPVIIYPHKFDYSQGFYDNQGFDHNKLPFIKSLVKEGYAVFFYDMMGFGNRIEEGTQFYERYPHWSKMGKLITDLKGAVDALTRLDYVDSEQISVLGYSLGATVGLYTAALDNRISSLVSISGYTPMRTDVPEKGTEGIKAYSHLHGLIPKLGFFVNQESRIPYDFDEILGSIAPRPTLIVAPTIDQDATLQDVEKSVSQAKRVYQLYNSTDNINFYAPKEYNRFSRVIEKKVLKWYKFLLDKNN